MTTINAVYLVVSNAVNMERDKSILYSRLVALGFTYCFFSNYQVSTVSYLVEGVGFFGGLFSVTPTTLIFSNFLYLLSAIILQLTSFYPRKIIGKINESIYFKFLCYDKNTYNFFNKMSIQYSLIEYPLIILFAIIGGVFFMSCGDVISIFLSVELQSYALYLLAAIYKNSELSSSAALTYFLLGSLSSTFILLGSSLFYSNSGCTSLEGHYIMTAIFNVSDRSEDMLSGIYDFSYLNISLLVAGVGFLFKISGAPFHFWSPDVYDSIPTIVTTFVAIIAKISILVLLLELVHYTSNFIFDIEFNWIHSLLVSSFLSFIFGAILGLSQPRIKKLLAYSTISHIGFILLAVAINTIESIEAFIFYVMQYSLSNLNMFFILIAIGFSLYPLVYENKTIYEEESGNLPERNNSPIQLITELRGYFYINPILALSMAITLFSFIGIPPLMGFFAKQMVLLSALNNGYMLLVVVAILASVISASYYLNIIKEIFFESSSLVLDKEFINKTYKYILQYVITITNKPINIYNEFNIYNVIISSFFSFTISMLTILQMLFMFSSQEWLRTIRIMAIISIEPK